MRVRVCIESSTQKGDSLSYVEGIYRNGDLKKEDVTVDTCGISWANARGPLSSIGSSGFDDQCIRDMMVRIMDVDVASLGLDYKIDSRVEDIV